MQELALLVLTALADAPRHGYAIAQEVKGITDGRVVPRTGALYGALDRLVAEGLIEVRQEEIVDGRARRVFALAPMRPRAARPGDRAAGRGGPGGQAAARDRRCPGDRVIDRLLWLYPSRYRTAYGPEIAGTYRDMTAGASRGARVREGADLAAHALRVRFGLRSADPLGRFLATAAPFALASAAAVSAVRLTRWCEGSSVPRPRSGRGCGPSTASRRSACCPHCWSASARSSP